ncbi:PREDICTED: intracellular protein transport protein USO1-like [Lupinus angustifolius]|uniref:intracellular protein transport protein USO1-like n=1 Tax=Lupinus angustifolius TaxID=3871 RepID=UPI00092E2E7D|nr:PREDICTED: intracellular protein transport protein USO1-like [Lupinus angustifolius]
MREQMNIVDGKRKYAQIKIMRKNHEIEKLKKELKIENEAFVPATLKKAKTEASVEIYKLKEQLETQRRIIEMDSKKRDELKEELKGFKMVIHLRDVRIVELERDLRSSQQEAVMGQDQVAHLTERLSHLQEMQQNMDEYREALAKAKCKTKWYKRMAYELQSECNNMGLELKWREEDKQKELEAAKIIIEEVEGCKEMWKQRSISLLEHWETLSYGWLEDFESVYQESIKVGVNLPTNVRAFFNDYHNKAQGVRNWRESMGWINPEPKDGSTFLETIAQLRGNNSNLSHSYNTRSRARMDVGRNVGEEFDEVKGKMDELAQAQNRMEDTLQDIKSCLALLAANQGG